VLSSQENDQGLHSEREELWEEILDEAPLTPPGMSEKKTPESQTPESESQTPESQTQMAEFTQLIPEMTGTQTSGHGETKAEEPQDSFVVVEKESVAQKKAKKFGAIIDQQVQ